MKNECAFEKNKPVFEKISPSYMLAFKYVHLHTFSCSSAFFAVCRLQKRWFSYGLSHIKF